MEERDSLMTSPYLLRQRRPLWKALADTGLADYFRWNFRAPNGRIYIVSVGKAHKPGALRHAASRDTCEVILWCKDNHNRDLEPVEISPLLHPWTRFFDTESEPAPIARHMPDSILSSMVGAIGYYLGTPVFAHSLLSDKRAMK